MTSLLIWCIALLLILLIIKGRFLIWNVYHSIIIHLAIRKAQKRLRAIGKDDIAKNLTWDKKWYGY
jgi:hypothetical protein